MYVGMGAMIKAAQGQGHHHLLSPLKSGFPAQLIASGVR
jgi:hypothetical protein